MYTEKIHNFEKYGIRISLFAPMATWLNVFSSLSSLARFKENSSALKNALVYLHTTKPAL
jgi:hypothetical protein